MKREAALVETILILVIIMLGAPMARASDTSPGKAALVKEAEELYAKRGKSIAAHEAAMKKWYSVAKKLPDDYEIQCRVAKYCYYYAQRLKNGEKGYPISKKGMAFAKKARTINPKGYDGHYWYYMNMLHVAGEDGITDALKQSATFRDELLVLKKKFPKRFETYMMLCALYREVPSMLWGDLELAVKFCKVGAMLAPTNAEMLLEYGETLYQNEDVDKAIEVFTKATKGTAPKDMSFENKDARKYAKKRLEEIQDY